MPNKPQRKYSVDPFIAYLRTFFSMPEDNYLNENVSRIWMGGVVEDQQNISVGVYWALRKGLEYKMLRADSRRS